MTGLDNKMMERAAFAEWLARQHLGFDSRLTEVVYLPEGAPDDEVRLLEINLGLYLGPGDNPIIPVQTTPSDGGLPFRAVIADITPEEWDRVRANRLPLPPGWGLGGYTVYGRKRA